MTVQGFASRFGKDQVQGVTLDVTQEDAVIAAMGEAVLGFGGLDIVVNNAGISSAAPVEDTTLDLWNKNMISLVCSITLTLRCDPGLESGEPRRVCFTTLALFCRMLRGLLRGHLSMRNVER